ncbi:MAG TPA: Gfo/Idh/MocA family oxidoreductase [Terriglobales bacterium]|jgi:predicted dehydrogenase|nr:Gfo/Idh/MocA family oxidoreductase [Terriglobales bacterium]
MEIPRAAVIGAGFVGRAHIESLRRQGIPVLGVLGSSPDRATESAKSLRLQRAYRSLEELVADRDVDVVHVCTPNYLHAKETSALLKAGKHVMCEKPLAMNAPESAELVELARKEKRVGGVTYNLRYYPLCQQARSMISSGAIGEPRLVHGSFLQDWLLYPTDWNWRLETKLGGDLRAVSDIGTHWMDLTSWIVGRSITEVCADLATVIPIRKKPRGRVETFRSSAAETDDVKIATDDYASVLVHLDGGARGVYTLSQVSAGRKARLWYEIDGSEASLAFDSENPNTLWIGRRKGPNEELMKDPSLMSAEARGYSAYPGGHIEGYPDTFMQLFKDFYSYIGAGDLSMPRTFPTFEDGHREMMLCDAIALSGKERRWVTVD